MHRRDFGLFTAALVASLAQPALGSNIDHLKIDGDILDSRGVWLDDRDLLEFEQTSFETSTLWTEGVRRFSGPPLQLLLEELGAGPGDVRLTAVNNYSVAVKRSLLTAKAPIVANRIDDKPFNRREKGPLWVMVPFDQSVDFQNEVIYQACVWQLSQIRKGTECRTCG